MNQFKNQIEEIAAFAKANGFNVETEFNELIKAWIKMTYKRSIWIQNNRVSAMKIVKNIL